MNQTTWFCESACGERESAERRQQQRHVSSFLITEVTRYRAERGEASGESSCQSSTSSGRLWPARMPSSEAKVEERCFFVLVPGEASPAAAVLPLLGSTSRVRIDERRRRTRRVNTQRANAAQTSPPPAAKASSYVVARGRPPKPSAAVVVSACSPPLRRCRGGAGGGADGAKGAKSREGDG